ncbi:MAG: right-handed parallel beta-helix repeat-containing protein, partial [Ferruginibacter sp.]
MKDYRFLTRLLIINLALMRNSLKVYFFLAFLLFASNAHATNYYLSNSGNDANNGTDPSSAWKSLAKLNSFKNLKPGDSVLFKKGDSFYGSITVTNSGSAGNPIVYSAYGTGAKPLITCFTTVNKWTNMGGNIWESTNVVSTLSTCNIVVMNGATTAMGRYPNKDATNKGFLIYTSHSDNNSITGNITDKPNWTGAELIIKKERWTFDRSPIVNHSGGTLSYTAQTDYLPKDGYGYFIQNDIRTLDQNEEWYYNSISKRISIYSTTSPSNVQISSIDNNVYGSGKNYITFSSIKFTASNMNSLEIKGSIGLMIKNCDILYSGNNGLFGFNLSNTVIDSTTFNHINNNGILFWYNCPDAIITNNHFKNIGLNLGLATGIHYASCTAMTLTSEGGGSPNALIQGNTIDSVGYIGISGGDKNTLIKNNVITNFCMTKDDGGGIYPSSGISDSPIKIIGNIILNGKTAKEGTADHSMSYTWGIYIDDNAHDIEVCNNTVEGMPNSGIFIHNAYNINIISNTSYNNKEAQLSLQHDLYHVIKNISTNQNIFATGKYSQLAVKLYSSKNDLSNFGNIDSNYYSVNSVNSFFTRSVFDAGTNRIFENWKVILGIDSHSLIQFNDSIRFEYNATSTDKSVALDASYIDLANKKYSGIIIIAPFSSVLLIYKGESLKNLDPIANAGSTQTITLPVNYVSLSGSGTDVDGTIIAYLWTKISGPSAGIISNMNGASTSITGMIQGTYQFELKLTDNSG